MYSHLIQLSSRSNYAMTYPPSTQRRTRTSHAPSKASREVLERDRVLDAAMGLLLEVGPARVRLADLARRLGVVPSALHYHFSGGKEEVITALFDREEARVVEAMARAIATEDSPRHRLRALAAMRLQNATRLARLHQSDGTRPDAPPARGTTTANEIQDYVMQRRQGFLNAERRLVADIFRDVASRRISPTSLDLLAAAFQGALFNVTRTFSLTTSRKADAMLTELVDLFFDGVERA